MMRTSVRLFLGAPLLAVALAACRNHHSRDVVGVVVTGVAASHFQTLADYLDDPAVQALLDRMSRHQGSSPPDVSGRYLAAGTIVATSVPGVNLGDAAETEFCLGPPAGTALEIAVIDATAVDAGALSFIEGSGDRFTAYTAFKSVQTGPTGDVCEVHQVLLFSGERQADGSISSLEIGLAIVGLVGDCGNLAVDQLQVSLNTGDLLGDSCVGGATPTDPTRVLLEVDNFLVTDVDVFVDGAFAGTAPLLSALVIEVDPGFTLSFESVPPANESGDPMGEVLAGDFSADTQPAGRFSQYAIVNQVGGDIYFAPLIWNQTSGGVTARVNVGTAVEFDCGCDLPASPLAQYVVGYHFYDAPGVIAADETNVEIGPAADPAQFAFDGPFTLGLDSGTLSLIVPP